MRLMVVGCAVVGLAAAAGYMLTTSSMKEVHLSAGANLKGADYAQLRRQALDLFPRGAPVDTVKSGLLALGFRCAPARRLLPNINAPSMECDSAGRGYPSTPRIEVTVLARNGVLSDIAVGDGMDFADARNPDPDRKGEPPAAP